MSIVVISVTPAPASAGKAMPAPARAGGIDRPHGTHVFHKLLLTQLGQPIPGSTRPVAAMRSLLHANEKDSGGAAVPAKDAPAKHAHGKKAIKPSPGAQHASAVPTPALAPAPVSTPPKRAALARTAVPAAPSAALRTTAQVSAESRLPAATIAGGGAPSPSHASPHGTEPAAPGALVVSPGHSAALPQAAGGTSTSQPSTLATPVAKPGWDTGFASHVTWMANQSMQHAELHLNPPELGPLHVSLTLHNDQASAQFVAHHPAVREAVEAALPKLREMLAGSGIMLGNATVSADSSQGGAYTSRQATRHREPPSPLAAAPGAPAASGTLRLPRGVVDIFA